MIESRPLHFFDAFFRSENEDLIETYTANWHFIPSHYPAGWEYNFWEPNRFLNRVIYHHLASLDERCSVLDFGCYDGLLVAALNENGFDAFGYESMPCEGMFDALGIRDKINVRPTSETVIAFGVAQEYSFLDFLKRIEEENNGLPDVLFFDREPTRPTIHNRTYFSKPFMALNGITSVQFPGCVSERSRAEMLIWRRDANG